jgi:hypothetical protein
MAAVSATKIVAIRDPDPHIARLQPVAKDLGRRTVQSARKGNVYRGTDLVQMRPNPQLRYVVAAIRERCGGLACNNRVGRRCRLGYSFGR